MLLELLKHLLQKQYVLHKHRLNYSSNLSSTGFIQKNTFLSVGAETKMQTKLKTHSWLLSCKFSKNAIC